MSTASYTISTTSYDSPFSASENYPDHSSSVLVTLSMFTSASHEDKLSGYTLDPDIQRNDVNNNRCDTYTIFYTTTDGTVGVYWLYRFVKHWLNDGVTTGITYEPSVSPNHGWLTWTDNSTHIQFEGTATDSSHAVEYELTVIAKLQSDGSQVDSFSTNFTIASNQPPIIGTMRSISINVPKGVIWGNGDNVIQDPENDALTITILVEGVSVDWISINMTDYNFLAWAKNENAGDHVVTVIVYDGYNTPVNTSFILTIIENYDPIAQDIFIQDAETGVNEYVSVVFLSVDDYFNDPENRPMTASVLQYNGDPLPSFLTYNSSNNTMYGTPTNNDVNDWLISYVATNDNGNFSNITFTLSVKP